MGLEKYKFLVFEIETAFVAVVEKLVSFPKKNFVLDWMVVHFAVEQPLFCRLQFLLR